jgi:hypothetical protein
VPAAINEHLALEELRLEALKQAEVVTSKEARRNDPLGMLEGRVEEQLVQRCRREVGQHEIGSTDEFDS